MEKMPPLVFHPDWFDIIEDLPQEQQLGIYRAIMLYAFKGEKPTDPIQRAVTSLMRKFIDKDREKYARAIQQRKEAIRKRWEKKQQQDKPNQTDTTEYDRKEPNTSEYEPLRADTNTNTNTIIQDQYQDHNQDQELKEDKSSSTSSKSLRKREEAEEAIFILVEDFKRQTQWIGNISRMFGITAKQVADQLDTFALEMACRGTVVNNLPSLFTSWMTERKRTPQDAPTEDGLGVGEFRDSQGRRTYDKGGVIIPETARPRPSVSHWWNEAMNDWCDTM